MAGPIRIAILANGAQARREINTVNTSLSSLGRLAKTGLAVAGVAGITRGIVGLGVSAVQLEAKFSTSMRMIAAATGAPASELKALNDLAIKLGADTSFSASEAADAMLELAKAGIDTKTIMGGGLAGTLQLAAAGGTELGTAATIASNALNTFGLAGKDMSKIAAALAGGANASTASVESLGQGLSQVGPGAINAGLSLQQTVAALSAFDQAGIKGSDAGTSLKTMLARLIPSTEKAGKAMEAAGLDFVKGNGEFESLTNIAGQLQKQLGGLSEAQRAQALNTIFGSDASRAATVLVKEGAEGIRGYIKATKDQEAAQEAAAARMGGTAGALERLSGAAETAKLRLGQELAPVVTSVADGLGDNLVPAMNAVIDGGKELGGALAPAVIAIGSALDGLIPSAETTGSVFNDTLIPAVRTLSELVAGAVGIVDGLPGPIKEIGVQAGIAALVLPRLAAGVTGASTAMRNASTYAGVLNLEMRDSAGRAQLASTAMSKLGAAAGQAAGIGGMLALTAGAQSSNTAIGILASAGGGALLGFSVGGPVGAAIGGGAGALLGLATQATKSKDALVVSRQPALDFASSLDTLTGSVTAATRELVFMDLQQRGAFENAAALGVSQRDLVSSVLGVEGAQKRVNAALLASNELSPVYISSSGRMSGGQYGMSAAAQELARSLGISTEALQVDIVATREKGIAVSGLGKVLKGLPKAAITDVRATGLPESQRGVVNLARQYRLTPKQIRTVINASGVDTSVKGVQRVIDKITQARNTKGDLPNLKSGVQQSIRVAEQAAGQGGANIARKLKDGTGKAKADLGGFRGSLGAQIGQAEPIASTGGFGVGGALKSGVIAGFAGTSAILSGQAAAAVRAAIAAARAAGKVKSPSRETRYIGEMLGEGLAVGMASKQAKVAAGGAELIAAMFAGAVTGETVETAFSSVTDYVANSIETTFASKLKDTNKGLRTKYADRKSSIKKDLSGKAETNALNQAEKKYEKAQKNAAKANKRSAASASAATTAAINLQAEQLRGVAAQHDAITQQLNDQRAAYAGLVQQAQDYANTVRDSVVSSGSVIGLGQGTGFGSIDQLVSQLQAKVAAGEAYSQTIQALSAAGLNQTNLQQLIDAGVEGGIGTAQAILAGGPSAIRQINDLTAQLTVSGTELGAATSSALYDAGVQAAAGLVAGLQSQQTALAAAASELGAAVAAGIAAALAASPAPAQASGKMADTVVLKAKKKLKVKSPSQVFRDIGRFTAKGLTVGLGDVNVGRAGARMASALEGGFGAPSLAAFTGTGGLGGSAGQVNITIEVPPTADRAAIGREIQLALDAYGSFGGRTAAA